MNDWIDVGPTTGGVKEGETKGNQVRGNGFGKKFRPGALCPGRLDAFFAKGDYETSKWRH